MAVPLKFTRRRDSLRLRLDDALFYTNYRPASGRPARRPWPTTEIVRLLLPFRHGHSKIAPCASVVSDLHAPFIQVFLRHLELDRHMVLAPAISLLATLRPSGKQTGALKALKTSSREFGFWNFESEPGTNSAGAVILQRRVGKAVEPRRSSAYCWRTSSNVLTCYKCLIVEPKKKRRLARNARTLPVCSG